MSSTHTPDSIYAAAANLAERRDKIEINLLMEIFHAPCRTIPVAQAARIDRDSFSAADYRLLFISAEVAADYGADRATTLACAERLLGAHDCWWAGAGIAPPFGPFWSRANLQILAGARYFSPTAINIFADQLNAIERRQREASEHLAYAHQLLMEVA